MITKDKWVAVMRVAGFTEDDMYRWHKDFEKAAPGNTRSSSNSCTSRRTKSPISASGAEPDGQ